MINLILNLFSLNYFIFSVNIILILFTNGTIRVFKECNSVVKFILNFTYSLIPIFNILMLASLLYQIFKK